MNIPPIATFNNARLRHQHTYPPFDATGDQRELVDRVQRCLAEGSEELIPRAVNDQNFVTEVVRSLHWDFRAEVTAIHHDMWSMVVVTRWDGDGEQSDCRPTAGPPCCYGRSARTAGPSPHTAEGA